MNDELNHALALLATKLGTTGEHLWGVLLRQVPINALFDFVATMAWVAFTVWFALLTRRKTQERERKDASGYTYLRAEWSEEGACFAWAAVIITTFLSCLFVSCSAPQWAAAIMNPEYNALREVGSFFRRK